MNAVVFSNLMLWWVRYFNEFEISGMYIDSASTILYDIKTFPRKQVRRSTSALPSISNIIFSLERIQQYLNIEHEPVATPEGVPPAYWPASGHIRVENLSAKYSEVFCLLRISYAFILIIF
jgi:hypothetical protein